jgi:hypothetical protein
MRHTPQWSAVEWLASIRSSRPPCRRTLRRVKANLTFFSIQNYCEKRSFVAHYGLLPPGAALRGHSADGGLAQSG